ncbi:unnamed protein product, partial [marine sediment metagenome]
YDKDFINQHVDNYKNLFTEVEKIDENKIYRQTGLDRKTIQEFINLLLKYNHKTLFIVGFGPQKYFYGGKLLNTIALIQILLGNFGKPGTGFLFSQSDFNKEFLNPLIDYITIPKTLGANYIHLLTNCSKMLKLYLYISPLHLKQKILSMKQT